MRAKWLGLAIVAAVLAVVGSRLAPPRRDEAVGRVPTPVAPPAPAPEATEPAPLEPLPLPDDPPPLPSTVAEGLRDAESARAEGRLAVAERAFAALADGPGAVEARKGLVEVLWVEGRFDEVRELVEDAWRAASGPGASTADEAEGLLGFALALAHNPLPIDRLRAEVERAASQAPGDDRVCLAQANLALRIGRLDEAAERLVACERARPDDPAVLRARVDWAVAADRPDNARAALARLAPETLRPAQAQRLRAWLAARDGDLEAERAELSRLLTTGPGDLAALDRLAELAASAGRPDEAARLRRRKAEGDDLVHRYRGLLRDGAFPARAAELAPLAEALGRRFEAVGLWTTALRLDPNSDDARAALDRLAAAEGAKEKADPAVARASFDRVRTPAKAPLPDRAAPAPTFVDDARASGLDFVHDPGVRPSEQLPAMSCGGVALLDYDGDGRLDVYCVQAGPFPPDPDARCADRLYRNRGDGTFEDVSKAAGIAALPGGYGHGVAVGDVDNDGHPDLFVTRWRSYALYRNRGDGTFEDATANAGLGGDRDWPTSAAFADLDGDGDLDLYVCHYLAWDADHPGPAHTNIPMR